MFEVLYEPPVAEDATPAPPAGLDAIIADSRSGRRGRSTFLGMAHYGRADARVDVWHDPADGGMLYVTNVYDGASRRLPRAARRSSGRRLRSGERSTG